jgi:hypothetical protein
MPSFANLQLDFVLKGSHNMSQGRIPARNHDNSYLLARNYAGGWSFQLETMMKASFWLEIMLGGWPLARNYDRR